MGFEGRNFDGATMTINQHGLKIARLAELPNDAQTRNG
jgi:hypothetical protein